MNARQKGQRAERELDEILTDAGYNAIRPTGSRYGDKDMWNEFDILAIQPETGEIAAVQVKSNDPYGITNYFESAAEVVGNAPIVRYMAVRLDGEPGPHTPPPRWRLARSDGTGYEWIVDERQPDEPADGEAVEAYFSQTLDEKFENPA